MKKIDRTMTFEEILKIAPEAAYILMRYGLHCIGCHISAYESLEEGAKAHGLSDESIDKMVEEVNKSIATN